MQAKNQSGPQASEIPADCFNRVSRMCRDSGGYLELRLPGLQDAVLITRRNQWHLWNQRLGQVILTWEDFRNGKRQALNEAVECTMQIHPEHLHTVLHRVFESIRVFCRGSAIRAGRLDAQVFDFPVERCRG